jgi:hypothetical protein
MTNEEIDEALKTIEVRGMLPLKFRRDEYMLVGVLALDQKSVVGGPVLVPGDTLKMQILFSAWLGYPKSRDELTNTCFSLAKHIYEHELKEQFCVADDRPYYPH